ncbi:diguanylate cyclase domain-containing protein [Geminocystis herdmanii]|uniref:diguanylate cyclase domain-containing protein n=1 Tax=Geminocystis herdmanii TaxID=669359 RepID=UPI00034AB62B|nr:diguanylate cyclase [Geminocystis herdmanii]
MNIPTDFYYPPNTNQENFTGITILILQGVDVDKKEYQYLANLLTEKGYGVMIPNFYQGEGYLCPDDNSVNLFFQDINNFDFDFFTKTNFANNLIVFGHSAGGRAILQSLSNLTILPLGIILYGCYALKPAINSSLFPPILVMAGDKDNITKSEVSKSNFTDNLLGHIKIFLKLENCDHFIINNSHNLWQKEENKVSLTDKFNILIRQQQQDKITQIVDEFIKGCASKSFDWFQQFNLYFIKEIIFNNQSLINHRDSLTKVGNSRYFRSNLEQIWQNCLNNKASFSLIFCNINHFRSYNNIYGHQQGDRCLMEIANIIQNSVRDIESFIARYGGDEFGIILPNSDENNTKKYGEKITQNIDNAKIAFDSPSQNIQYVSVRINGYTIYPQETISFADFIDIIKHG